MTAEPASAGRRRIAKEALAGARALYEGDPEISQIDICRRFGLTAGTLAYHARREGWERAEGGKRYRNAGPRDKRARLVARLYRAFERQVEELENRLGDRLKAEADGAGGDAAREPQTGMRLFDDRDAKLLSTLAQTLSRLAVLDGGAAPEKAAGGEDQAGDGDLDEFRRSLAQRLETLVESGDRKASGDPRPARDRGSRP